MPPERILARATGRPEEPEEPDLDKALSDALLALDRRLSALETRLASSDALDLCVEGRVAALESIDNSALDGRLSALESRLASSDEFAAALDGRQTSFESRIIGEFELRVEDNLLVLVRPDGSRCSIDLLTLPRRAVQRSLTFQRDPETNQISGAIQTEETT